MQVTMTNRELLGLYEAAKKAAEAKAGLKFAYALARNLGRIDKDCDALTGAFQKKRQAVIDELCLRDAFGKPIITNNEYQFTPANREVFDEKMLELQQEVDGLMETEATYDLHLIKLEHFPTEIEPWIVKGLLPVTEE